MIIYRILQERLLQLKEFLKERVLFELQIQNGSRDYEIAMAVFQSGFDDLSDVYYRIEIMSQMHSKETEVFQRTAKVLERTSNILKGSEGDVGAINQDLLQDPMEQKLFDVIQKNSSELREALMSRQYEKATRLYGQAFFDPLNEFFDQVMVNVENQDVRRNRQALMKEIYSLYALQLADLSLLSRMD